MNCLRKIFCKIYSGISRNSYLLSAVATDEIPKTEDILKGRGKTSSELIFRSDYFHLIGNDPISDTGLSNSWYLERIVRYCERTEDPNMIAVLRKIASGHNADEAARHRAAGLIDMLEERRHSPDILKGKEASKNLNAMILLSGSRTPQTTEILRLLRDKSIVSRRYALLMIGKFRLTDLAGEVCDCLPVPGLCRVAANVLQSFGSYASADLIHLYMNLSGNRETGRIIVTLLGKTGSNSDDEFIFSLLWSNTREIRFVAAATLRNNRFVATGDRAEKVNKIISEAIGVIAWNLAARESLEKIGKTNLVQLIDAEISDWKSFIINLLGLCADKTVIEAIEKLKKKGNRVDVCYAIELIEKNIHESVKDGLINLFEDINWHSRLKRLRRKWPVPVQVSGNLFEDIINRDYNLINTWTKASALRHLPPGDNEGTFESVKALLFSPLRLLREEAALALTRSGRSLPDDLISRLPEEHLYNTRKITGGSIKDNDLFYFSVAFLAGLFPGIPPEELITLAGSLRYYLNEELTDDIMVNSIAWQRDETLVVRRCFIIIDENIKMPLLPEGKGPWIILSLDALDNFLLGIPGRTTEIYDYLDRNGVIAKQE